MKKKMSRSLSLVMVFWLVKAIPCLGYFGDVNLKAGLDINGTFHLQETSIDFPPDIESPIPVSSLKTPLSVDAKTGFCFGAEVFPFFLPLNKEDNNKHKLGIGLQYKISREIDLGFDFIKPPAFAFFPVYLTYQIKPFANSQDEAPKGIFVKVDLGYSFIQEDFISFKYNNIQIIPDTAKGGLYYALGIGYELPSGLSFSLMFNVYSFKQGVDVVVGDAVEKQRIPVDFDVNYKDIGINIGYKFKI